MSAARRPAQLAISVQETGNESCPRKGHVAPGVLAGPETIVVIERCEEFLDASRRFEALLIPLPLDETGPVERIAVDGVQALRRIGDEAVTSVFLTLAHKSAQPIMFNAFDGCDLRREMGRHGDLRLALERLEAVTPQAFDGPPPEVFDALPDHERRQREARLRVIPYRTPGDNSWNICDLIVWPCHPCRRR